MLGDAGQHFRSDLCAIVEGENEIRPARAGQNTVRGPGLPLYYPTDTQ
jgi:hypothetical protein